MLSAKLFILTGKNSSDMLELIEARNMSGLTFFVAVRVVIILTCWLFMIVSSIVDFWSGITTAKALGIPLMSKGFRRTITKIGDYIKVMLFVLMFDILGSLLPFYIAPFATILCTVAIIYIECKSVIENSRRKNAHAADIPGIVAQIVKATTAEHGRDVLKQIVDKIALDSKSIRDYESK